MNEEKRRQGAKGEFFCVDLAQVRAVASSGGGADAILALMVLSRGVNRRGDHYISSHGTHSVAHRSGMTRTRSEKALRWLTDHGYIQPPGSVAGAPSSLAGPANAKAKSRWIMSPPTGNELVFLPNALVDGIAEGKANPPLSRLFNDIQIGPCNSVGEVRLDSISLLLQMYLEHDLEGCGGIDPRTGIYRQWNATENTYGNSETPLASTNAALYEIERGDTFVFDTFAARALQHIAEASERNGRFWHALHELHNFGFWYEATVLWAGNPTDDSNEKAEPLYTLYIHDKAAREVDPFLQREIHTAAIKLEALDRYTEFSALGFELLGSSRYDDSNIIGTGRFRFLARQGAIVTPIGTCRLRFRPRTRDMGIGIEAERRRVQHWVSILAKIS